MQQRFHLDAPNWFGESEEPAHLRAIAGALLRDTLIQIRYHSWRAEKHRRVAPLGLVLKAGSWYLAGSVDGSVRTYRVARDSRLQRAGRAFRAACRFRSRRLLAGRNAAA